jgi:hypothetical protein
MTRPYGADVMATLPSGNTELEINSPDHDVARVLSEHSAKWREAGHDILSIVMTTVIPIPAP